MYSAAPETLVLLATDSHESPVFVVYRLPLRQNGGSEDDIISTDLGISVGPCKPHAA